MMDLNLFFTSTILGVFSNFIFEMVKIYYNNVIYRWLSDKFYKDIVVSGKWKVEINNMNTGTISFNQKGYIVMGEFYDSTNMRNLQIEGSIGFGRITALLSESGKSIGSMTMLIYHDGNAFTGKKIENSNTSVQINEIKIIRSSQ